MHVAFTLGREQKNYDLVFPDIFLTLFLSSVSWSSDALIIALTVEVCLCLIPPKGIEIQSITRLTMSVKKTAERPTESALNFPFLF